MTKLGEKAIAAKRKLPPERQNELAEVLLSASSETPPQIPIACVTSMKAAGRWVKVSAAMARSGRLSQPQG